MIANTFIQIKVNIKSKRFSWQKSGGRPALHEFLDFNAFERQKPSKNTNMWLNDSLSDSSNNN